MPLPGEKAMPKTLPWPNCPPSSYGEICSQPGLVQLITLSRMTGPERTVFGRVRRFALGLVNVKGADFFAFTHEIRMTAEHVELETGLAGNIPIDVCAGTHPALSFRNASMPNHTS